MGKKSRKNFNPKYHHTGNCFPCGHPGFYITEDLFESIRPDMELLTINRCHHCQEYSVVSFRIDNDNIFVRRLWLTSPNVTLCQSLFTFMPGDYGVTLVNSIGYKQIDVPDAMRVSEIWAKRQEMPLETNTPLGWYRAD